MVAVLLCLPCSVKREVKQTFNIPVSEYVKTEFQSGCTFSADKELFSETSSQNFFNDFPKNLEPIHVFRFQALYNLKLVQRKNHYLTKLLKPHLPLFILNEKYLI